MSLQSLFFAYIVLVGTAIAQTGHSGTGLSLNAAPSKCVKGDQTVDVGKHFISNNFKFICQELGAYTIVACISPRDKVTEIPLGQTREKCGWTWKCNKTGGTAFMEETYDSSKDKCEDPSLRPTGAGGTLDVPPFGIATGTSSGSSGSSSVGTGTGSRGRATGTGSMGTASSTGSTGSGTGSRGSTGGSSNKCTDMNKKTYNPGEEWTDKRGKYRCGNNGLYETIACVSKEGKLVPVHGQLDLGNGKMGVCQKFGNTVFYIEQPTVAAALAISGSTSTSTGSSTGSNTGTSGGSSAIGGGTVKINAGASGEPPNKDAPCFGIEKPGTYPQGTRWNEQGFIHECGVFGYHRVVGCVAPDGTEMELNTEITTADKIRKCTMSGGVAEFTETPITNRDTCLHKGKSHAKGSTWRNEEFVYVCDDSGLTQITACLTDKKVEIPVNQEVPIGGLVHKCIQKGRQVTYIADFPGANSFAGKGGLAVDKP